MNDDVQFNGRAPMIRFGEEFEEWDDTRKIAYLKKLASTMNHAADVMQKERDELARTNQQLLAQLENSQKALDIQKSVTQNQLLQSNSEKQGFSKTIMDLQARVKAQDAVIEKLQPEAR